MKKPHIKSEHNGAKNRGGHHGKREEAKQLSRKIRRQNNKREISTGTQEFNFKKVMSSLNKMTGGGELFL